MTYRTRSRCSCPGAVAFLIVGALGMLHGREAALVLVVIPAPFGRALALVVSVVIDHVTLARWCIVASQAVRWWVGRDAKCQNGECERMLVAYCIFFDSL